jgi:hypothetical protein
MKVRLILCVACAIAGLTLAYGAPARADFFDDVRRTFQTDIPHFFQDDIPCAFGGQPTSHTKTSCHPARAATAKGGSAAPAAAPQDSPTVIPIR